MFKIIFVLLIISCIAPLFIEGPDGKPLMTVEEFKAKIAQVAGLVPGVEEKQILLPAPEKVYKWQDAEGNWQFGDAPPDADAQEVEVSAVNSMSGDPTAYLGNIEGTTARDAIREGVKDLPDGVVNPALELQQKIEAEANRD